MLPPAHTSADPADRDTHTDETAQLLLRAAQEDAVAFRRLYDMESPRLYAVALRITRQPSLASDAVHDAMLQVWRNAARFDPARGNARAWLTSLVRYRALDMITRTGELLHHCLQQIDAQRRRWVVMAFLDGFSHMEVAAHVRQPAGTVKSGIRRALLALRACLGGAE